MIIHLDGWGKQTVSAYSSESCKKVYDKLKLSLTKHKQTKTRLVTKVGLMCYASPTSELSQMRILFPGYTHFLTLWLNDVSIYQGPFNLKQLPRALLNLEISVGFAEACLC